MKEKKKKMLLIGPGYGHNTEGKIKSLVDCDLFDISFWAFDLDESFISKYTFINFLTPYIKINKKNIIYSIRSFFNAVRHLRLKGKVDVLYIMGTSGFFAAFLFFISRKNTIRVCEIWSNQIIDSASKCITLLDKCNKYILRKANYVCQYWWGIRERFVNTFPQYEKKFLMYQLSYPDIYFSNEKHTPESIFVKKFLGEIPEDQIICFWPRSFIPSNNHKLLLDALSLIKKNKPYLLDNFKLYLWGGNSENIDSRNVIVKSITDNSLDGIVEIVDHPFVPQNDIFAIEERSNFFVQIANDDILSTYIMEMICSCKPFLLSNLRTFQFLNEKYGMGIQLVENDATIIAGRIEDIILGRNKETITDFISRKEKCKRIFSDSETKNWTEILNEEIKKRDLF